MPQDPLVWNLIDGGTLKLYKSFISNSVANQILLECAGTGPEKEWSDQFLTKSQIKWNHDMITVGNRTTLEPRFTCFLGEKEGLTYEYSKKVNVSVKWPLLLQQTKEKIELLGPDKYNVVLANLYRNGEDHVSWHSDSETDLIPNSSIASLSIGSTRTFQLKNNKEVIVGQLQTKINTIRKKNLEEKGVQTTGGSFFTEEERQVMREFGLEGESEEETERRVAEYKVGKSEERNVSFEVENGDLVVMSGPIQKFWRHRIKKDPSCQTPRIAFTFRAVVS